MKSLPACFETSPLQLWTARPNGELEYVNGRVVDYFGRSFAEMVKWGWADVVHPEDLPRVGEKWSASLETGVDYRVEFRLRRHDGIYQWHLGVAEAIRSPDGPISRWSGANMLVGLLEHAGRD